MSSTETQGRTPGSLAAAARRHVARMMTEYTGRASTRARPMIRENVVLCVTQDGMTKAERRLTQEGENDLVVTIRRKFQTTMRDDLVGGIEVLTGRKVVSFMSDHNAETDHAAEIVVLDGPPETSSALSGEESGARG